METRKTSKKVYFNPGQLELMYIGANSETIIAARRFGKSDGIIAPRMLRNAQHMPKSAGAIYAATFQQALSRTLPAAVHALSRWGYINERHFFIGRKAPRTANFERPYIEPASWDHVIHWYNGRIQHILSQDVKFSANSLTLDDLMVDEGRSINPVKFFDEVVPAVSGLVGHFNDCPFHKGITIVSDMPHSKTGSWLLKREALMDRDLIDTIKATLVEINLLQKSKMATADRLIREHRKELNFMRKHAHVYREFDAIENLELLGEAYIKKMKRDLPPLIFQISILNKKLTRLVNGFYANLNPDIHYYDAFNNNYLDNQRTNQGSIDLKKIKSRHYLQDADVQSNKPLIIALDYNANINWIVTGQPYNNELRTISSMFVKNERKLRELIKDWCEYYKLHPEKTVVYYYDETALQGAYASSAETFSDIVKYELRKEKWNVVDMFIGKPMKHNLKHQYINDALTGRKYLFPTFNKSNNEFLLPAMENTGVMIGRNGFEKNKSGEKLEETEEDPLELRTDGTDAWDTLFIGMNFHPVHAMGISYGNVYRQ